ncbi:MAG: polysaccharide biosynthesis protein, partial [Alphaproteobacteria bacterium]|nr:polysaccharide biosynthesis protein [Alphaproteobacteria bacterium]
LQASAHGLMNDAAHGEIFVLDMGEPIRIVDIAERMIRLAGYQPDVDVKIKIVGRRPGEKLTEELFQDCETRISSPLPGVLRAKAAPVPMADLKPGLAKLFRIAENGLNSDVVTQLAAILPDYRRHQVTPINVAPIAKPREVISFEVASGSIRNVAGVARAYPSGEALKRDAD